MNIPIVPQDRIGEKKPYPYLTYKFITPYTPFEHQGNKSNVIVNSVDPLYESDIEETLTLQPQMTMSVNAYYAGGHDNQMDAYEVAKKAMNWFKQVGYYDLSEINIVVVDINAFGDRTTLITDDYEARVGFDVTMRTVDEIKRINATIDNYDITRR